MELVTLEELRPRGGPGHVLDALRLEYGLTHMRPWERPSAFIGAARAPAWATDQLPQPIPTRARVVDAGRRAGQAQIARATAEGRRQAARLEAELREKFRQETGVPLPPNMPTNKEDAIKLGVRTAQSALERQTGYTFPAKIPTSQKELEKLGKAQAQALAAKALAEYGVPPIVLDLPDFELSAEGVRDVAYAAGKEWAEDAIAAEFGYPIELPDRFTAEALVDSLASIIPTDVAGFIDAGIAYGTQVAAGALTTLLAGTAIGSVIPGLGTVVGIAVALSVMAIRGWIEGPEQAKCETRIPKDVPAPFTMGPIEQMPYTVMRLVYINGLIDKERGTKRGKERCRGGPIVEYAGYLSTLYTSLSHASEDTPSKLGLPQLAHLIPLYERTPKHPYVVDFLRAMKARQAELQAKMARAARVDTIPIGQLGSVRWDLVTEMRTAGVQLAYAPGPQTEQWFRELAQAFARVDAREKAQQAKRKAEIAAGRRRYEAASAEQLTEHEKDLLQLRCSDGDEAACQRYRDLASGKATAGPAALARLERDVGRGCLAMAVKWANDNPDKAKCLNHSETTWMLELCKQVFLKTMAPAEGAAKLQEIVTQACARGPAAELEPAWPCLPLTSLTPTMAQDAAGRHCGAMLTKWAADNPTKAGCLTLADRQRMYDLCYQTFGPRTLTPALAFQQIQAVVAQACARAGVPA